MIEHYYFDENVFGSENWFGYSNLYKSIVENCQNGSKIVEVGSWMGRSTSYMAVEIYNSKKDIEFYCVDTWEGGPDHQEREELSELYNIFLHNMKPVEGYYIPLKDTSLNASKKFEDESLDFVFIDASHEYEDVKNDILAWLPKVKPGGILAGHDYYSEGCYDWFPGVKRAVNECLDNFKVSESEACFIYKKPINFCPIKVLFFGRNSKDEVWEHDFILNDILPKDNLKKTYFLSLDEVRNSSDTFDVFVYSARYPNNYPWGYIPTYDEVLECVLKTKPKVVIQLSDEFYEEDLQEHNSIANYCELFLRQYNHSNYQYTKNTLHIPLGHYNGYNVSREKIKPIKERVYSWSFVGSKKSDRISMINTFSTIPDNYCLLHEGSITIPAEELIEIYINSIFVPCSRGWELLNTMRSYEVSMSGAIPILVGTQEEIENTFKYEENPPWLFFDSWENAAKKCQELLNDTDALQQIQTNILSWWDTRMEKIQKRTSMALTEKIVKNCIYYCFFGNEIYLPLLELSLKSLNNFFGKENIVLFSDRELPGLEKYSKVIVENFPDGYTVPMAYRLILGKRLLKEYDNVLHLDIDTVVVSDVNHIFNLSENNKISFAKDIGKVSKIIDKWWSGPLLSSEELEKYADVNSICCGVFLFNKTCENVLEKIYDYVVEIEETGYRGPCADQHAFSTFVLRNDYYNYNLNDFVDHNGINLAIPIEAYNKSYVDVEHKMFEFDKQICIYHFPGGAIPGKSAIDNKYDSMKILYNSFINKNHLIKLDNKSNSNSNNDNDMKVLFFGRNSRDDVWEHDFILNDILPKDHFKKTYFLSLDEVRNSLEHFDVFVYSCRDPNIYEWGYMPTYDEVLECVSKTKPKVVIQLSDEYKDEDLEHFNELSNYCELFLRQYNHQEYRNSKFKTNVLNDNIVYIPLGYCNGTPVDKIKTVPSSEKKYNWSFVGKIKDWEFCFFDNIKQKWVSVGDRTEMTETFKSNIQDFFFAQEGIDKDELIRIYSNSIFVPCGRGNSSLDCFRLYEASMCGAISVVVGSFGEIENTFRYEENPPWIFAESWDEAVKICKDLLNNKDHLQEVQNNLLSWWNNRINKIQDKVNNVFSNVEYNDYSYKLKNFPPINFISVDKSEDRRNLLYEKFDKYNLMNIRPHIFEVYNDEDHHYIGESFRELNGIGRGPTTSHLKAIKDWYFDTEEEYAFFCEDDISFETVKYWNFTWEEFFNSLPKDWECVQLCWVREGNMFLFSSDGVKLRHRCWCDWSACAYLVKRSHAKKLISHYYRNGSFNLDFIGNDSHVRPKWAKDPVAETIIFSPLGNPKNSAVNVSSVYGFPLFVEDFYNCESDLLKYDIGNVLRPQRVRNEMSYNTIINWWEMEGKNLKIKDIIDL